MVLFNAAVKAAKANNKLNYSHEGIILRIFR